jgi:hypothetical protein
MLVSQLRSWSARVAAGEALLLQLLGELDAREAWAPSGATCNAHWASWQLGLSLPTAREKVRVARALCDLPLLSAALAAGRMSYAQVRAISRVATPADEQTWVELAALTTTAQLERAVRGVGRVRGDKPDPELPTDRIAWEQDGTLLLTVRIAAAQAPGVLAAATAGGSAETPAEPGAPPYAEPYEYVEPSYPTLTPRVGLFDPRPAGEAEALAGYWAENKRRRTLQLAARAWADHVEARAAAQELPAARASLADGFVRALTRADGLPPVTVTLLQDPISGWVRTRAGELLPPSTLTQILKTLPGRTRRTTATVLELGRSSRLVSPALREHLGLLDGERCRFPSCTRATSLHAHHVKYWRDGEPTDLAKDKHESWYRPGYDAGCGVRADQFRPQRHRAGCRPAVEGLPGAC